MAHWLLAPIGHRAAISKTYQVQRIVVEAPDERRARKQVADAVPDKPLPNPWLDRALTSCQEVDPDAMTDG
jgi:hypothetical protein